jgi:phage repressor protein C with HTH and peptisase S24 domain
MTAMLSHAQIWAALDRLAATAGLSPSGLAKKSGLDPTTFNKSKRTTPDGRQRWPSTESVAKALAATGTSFDSFVHLIGDDAGSAPRKTLPMTALAQAATPGYFDQSGFPAGPGWEEIRFPEATDEHAYALEISGDALAPAFRDGTYIVVSPAASIRRGDRVVVKTAADELLLMELKRRTARTVELGSINAVADERAVLVRDAAWIARVLWASQ